MNPSANAASPHPEQQHDRRRTTALTDVARLPARDRDGRLHVVVEAPAGSRIALRFDPDRSAFVVARAPVVGVAAPCDLGFIPSTCVGGGALRCLLLGDAPGQPGLVVAARPIGLVLHRDGYGLTDERLVAIAADAARWSHIADARALPDGLRDDIEAFLAWRSLVDDVRPGVTAWTGIKPAQRRLRACEAASTR